MEQSEYSPDNHQEQPVKVLIVDDQNFVRLLLRKIFASTAEIECIDAVDSKTAALESLKSEPVDVLILDWEMPGTDTYGFIKEVGINFPYISILVYSSHQNLEYLQQAMTAGAKGYLLKGCADLELIDGIVAVNHGRTRLSKELFSLITKVNTVSPARMPENENDDLWTALSLERVQSTPKISLRALLYLILLLIALVISWSFLFKYTVTAKSSGKLIPSSKVFDMAVEQPGTVVIQGEDWVSIVPENSHPIFRGNIPVKDGRRLKVGMKAKLWPDNQSWPERGAVSGIVTWISPFSILDRHNQEVFALEIELEQYPKIKLNYGQTILADIAVEKRRIISFWLN
jgi:DNA-binding NarL/FixJ family response regulator